MSNVNTCSPSFVVEIINELCPFGLRIINKMVYNLSGHLTIVLISFIEILILKSKYPIYPEKKKHHSFFS